MSKQQQKLVLNHKKYPCSDKYLLLYKKDYCKVYNNSPQNGRANIKREFEVRHKNLAAARESKNIDKEFAQRSYDRQFDSACFDRQEVLTALKGV